MKDYAKTFYKSAQWKKTRELYAASVGGLCEICYQKGLIVPGEIVHHKIFISPENIGNPQITLNWQNLELVCRECHAAIHQGDGRKRYKILENGEVIVK